MNSHLGTAVTGNDSLFRHQIAAANQTMQYMLSESPLCNDIVAGLHFVTQ